MIIKNNWKEKLKDFQITDCNSTGIYHDEAPLMEFISSVLTKQEEAIIEMVNDLWHRINKDTDREGMIHIDIPFEAIMDKLKEKQE